jgi:hypothetical protein
VKLQEIRAIAKQYQINSSSLSKTQLIREVQRQEGNFDCFATACGGECDQLACMWRKDCFDAAAA